MSLATCISNYSWPIIVTDLVISEPASANTGANPTYIPSLNMVMDPRDFPGEQYHYTFSRKQITIKGKFCVAAAGKTSLIRGFFDNISDYFLYREITFQELRNFFHQYPATNVEKLSILVFFDAHDSENGKLGWMLIGEWNEINNPFFEKLIAAGTDAEKWSQVLNEKAELLDNPRIQPQFALQKILLTCAYFLDEERISPENLQNGWVGGFDIMQCKDGSFQYLEEVTYVFYHIDSRMDPSLLDNALTPVSIIKYSSGGNHLFIQHFNYHTNENKSYILSTINHQGDCEEPFDPSNYVSDTVVACVRIYQEDRLTGKVLYINALKPGEESIMNTMEIEGKLAFGFKTDYMTGLKRAILDALT